MKTAAYFGTRNVYDAMVPAVRSLIKNTSVERVVLFIEDDRFPYALPEICETRNLSGQTAFRKTGPNYSSKWTYMSMMRVALPMLLPEEERVLYLDIDTIVRKDISELWDLLIGDKYFAAVREPAKSRPGFTYINEGVMMMNLEKMRDGLAKRMIDELNRHAWPCKEQDLYSEWCQGQFLLLPGDYNASNFTDDPDEIKIMHYAAIPLPVWYAEPEVQAYAERREK